MHLGFTDRPIVHPLKGMSYLIHLQRRHLTKRCESHLLAKEGTIGISLSQSGISLRLKVSFTCPKVGIWDRLFNFTPKEGGLRIFYTEKIQRLRPGSNPRTRETEASTQTTRPPKPSWWAQRAPETCRVILYEIKYRLLSVASRGKLICSRLVMHGTVNVKFSTRDLLVTPSQAPAHERPLVCYVTDYTIFKFCPPFHKGNPVEKVQLLCFQLPILLFLLSYSKSIA
jgi:hypothetical protein